MNEQTLMWIALGSVNAVLGVATYALWHANRQIAGLRRALHIEEKYRWPKPGMHCHAMACFDSEGKCECVCGYSDRLAGVA